MSTGSPMQYLLLPECPDRQLRGFSEEFRAHARAPMEKRTIIPTAGGFIEWRAVVTVVSARLVPYCDCSSVCSKGVFPSFFRRSSAWEGSITAAPLLFPRS